MIYEFNSGIVKEKVGFEYNDHLTIKFEDRSSLLFPTWKSNSTFSFVLFIFVVFPLPSLISYNGLFNSLNDGLH